MNMPTQKARKKIRKNRSRQLRLSRSTPPLPRLLAAMARGGGKHAGWGRSSAPAPPRRQARTQWRAATSAAVPKYGPDATACPTAAARPRVRGPPSSPRALARWCGAPWRAQRRPPGPRGEVTGRGRSYTGRGPPRAPAKAGPSPTRALAPPLPAPARRLPAAPRQRRRRRSSSPFLPRATAAASERSDETRARARTKRPNSRIEIPPKLEPTRWRIGARARARAGERTPQRARWNAVGWGTPRDQTRIKTKRETQTRARPAPAGGRSGGSPHPLRARAGGSCIQSAPGLAGGTGSGERGTGESAWEGRHSPAAPNIAVLANSYRKSTHTTQTVCSLTTASRASTPQDAAAVATASTSESPPPGHDTRLGTSKRGAGREGLHDCRNVCPTIDDA